MLVLLCACAGAWAFPDVRDAGIGPNPRTPLEPECGTALPGTAFASSAGDVVLVVGAGRAAGETGAYHDCVGPIIIQEGDTGNTYTPREQVDYCVVATTGTWVGSFLYAAALWGVMAPGFIISPQRGTNTTTNGSAVHRRRYFSGSSGAFYIYICAQNGTTPHSACVTTSDALEPGETILDAVDAGPVGAQLARQCVHVPLDWKLPLTLGATVLGVVVTLGRLAHKLVSRACATRVPRALTESLVG
jgi:hypothetical protein